MYASVCPRVRLPLKSRRSEEISTTNLDDEIKLTPISQNRELLVSSQSTGHYAVKAEFEIRLRPRYSWDVQNELASLTTNSRSRFLRSEAQYNTSGSGVRKVLQEIPRGDMTDGEYVQRSFRLLFSTNWRAPQLKPDDKPEAYDDVGYALANHEATPWDEPARW